jgi:hypothetical protein
MVIEIGTKLKCIFNQPLPGNDHAPELELGKEYTCKGFHLESGNLHIDVGLPLKLNYVRSYATDVELPKTTHWCHPNRFIVIE